MRNFVVVYYTIFGHFIGIYARIYLWENILILKYNRKYGNCSLL